MKKIITILLMLVTLFCAGCTHSSDNKEIDIIKLKSALLSEVKYDDTMNEISEDMAKVFLSCDDDSKVTMYMGETQNKADTIIIIESKDENTATKDKENLDTYISDMKNEMALYHAEECSKFDNAIIKQNDRYVVCVITSDTENVLDILDDNF